MCCRHVYRNTSTKIKDYDIIGKFANYYVLIKYVFSLSYNEMQTGDSIYMIDN